MWVRLRERAPYPQIYPFCGYAVNKSNRTPPDDKLSFFSCFLVFYGRLWTFLEVDLVPQRGFKPLTHALRIRTSSARTISINMLRRPKAIYALKRRPMSA